VNNLFFDQPSQNNWLSFIGMGGSHSSEWVALFHRYRHINSQFAFEEPAESRYGKEILTKVRLGQGAFRVMVTDAYSRRCAITGEKTLPVLEAAHIKPYAKSGPHFVSNGLLLRSDMHKLFDNGYLTITKDLQIVVSKKIKEEFENGKEYYKYHGQHLAFIPKTEINQPFPSYLEWHNEKIFKG
jgi:putative restriction endonuclease